MMIKCGDCLELMKDIPDGVVDCILTDLPYEITSCAFDVRIPFEPMWEQFKRVTKFNAAIVLFSQMPFGAELIMSNRKMFRYEWIWEKSSGGGFLNAKKMPLRCHENILVFYQRLPTYNPQWTWDEPYKIRQKGCGKGYGWRRCREKHYLSESDGRRYPRDKIFFDSVQDVHPTQKPVDLLEYLIKTYTNEGETVLDATMGSGSTGVACVNTGRDFIGFEKEQHFFEIAQRRISEAEAKIEQSLFKEAIS